MKGFAFKLLQCWALVSAFVILDNAMLGGELTAQLKHKTVRYAVQVESTATELWDRLWPRA
jgi:hypothetical protein